MRALIRSKNHTHYIVATETATPVPKLHQTLVSVKASSVNRGELALLQARPDGWAPGQDFAGIVLQQAADGTGPKAGTPVVGLAEQGAWAEVIAVDASNLVELPAAVSFEDAATLPLAGLTALRTLRLASPKEDRRVLITAGTGGVGFYQMQLAKLLGSSVTAVVRDKAVRQSLRTQFSAITFVADIEQADGLYENILDGLGGTTPAKAISKVTPEGTILLFGNTTNEPTSFSLFNFMPGHENARILTYFSYYKPQPTKQDLAQLVAYMAEAKLVAPEKMKVSFADAARGIADMTARKIHGKLILTP